MIKYSECTSKSFESQSEFLEEIERDEGEMENYILIPWVNLWEAGLNHVLIR